MPQVTGTFEVKLATQPPYNTDDPSMGRRSIDKEFHGGLAGTSKGEMLSVGSAAGSGTYVALERVTGTLDGRTGTFALAHLGVMTRGTPSLSISVVPDSGTGDLEGLTGAMTILIEAGRHTYALDYALG